eukprot:m.69461 g.69461  ORF g.69461 m.69461 type:complete len:305 (+) comp12057_c0_seq2:107-1021(+)
MGGGPDKSGLSFQHSFILSGMAASIAETATFPMDIIKTRLQIQSKKDVVKRGLVQTGIGIVREEGFLRLYSGLFPACLRHVVYSGSRVMFYELLRENVFKRDADGNFPLWKGMLAGMTAGAAGQFIATPTDVLKVQLQMDGKRISQGQKPNFNGTWDCLRKLHGEGGILRLWRGWLPSCQRAALVQLGDLTAYDYIKHSLMRKFEMKDGPVLHASASAGAGLVAATMGTPADVIKTRVMNQPYENGKGVLYSGSLDCLRKTIAEDGFMSLYKGFVPSWLRMAPWSLIFFISFEQMRAAAGLSSF